MADIEPIKFKVVRNACFGGFGLSRPAQIELAKRKGIELEEQDGFLVVKGTWELIHNYVKRNDPDLVAVVEEMGEAANGSSSKLRVETVTVEIDFHNHDGLETVKVYGDSV